MNVSVEGNTVQVPFAVAAQVCGVDASVIAEKQESGDVACEIDQETAAQHNIGGGDQQQAEQEGGEEDGQAAQAQEGEEEEQSSEGGG